MQIKLEELKYQQVAIQSVVKVFDGTIKNTFDNSCFEGIRSNTATLSPEQISDNIRYVCTENVIEKNTGMTSKDWELTIEMETWTSNTLVYVKTICELYQHYGFTNFIVLVPSVSIRQGVLKTLTPFGKQLDDLYGFVPNSF